jgi:hypothetical protein
MRDGCRADDASVVKTCHHLERGQQTVMERGWSLGQISQESSPLMDNFLALGLVLAASSQLRIPGFPVGPGELCLTGWVLLSIVRALLIPNPRPSPALVKMVTFWIVFTFSLCLGTLMALASEETFETALFLHDAVAYVLIAFVSCMCVAGTDADQRLRRVAWMFVTLGTVSLALQLANGFDVYSISSIDPWFWERFRGWSSNPNQLSQFCGSVFLVALFLADSAAGHAARHLAICCMIMSFILGRLSGSDTFTLALIATTPCFFVFKVATWLRTSGRGTPGRASLAWLAVIAFPLLLLSAIPLTLTIASDSKQLAMGLAKNGGTEVEQEADIRVSLWSGAIVRGIKSGMLGLGPGPHLEIPASIVAAHTNSEQLANIDHPVQNGTANFEAHNTFLDLFTQGGLLAVTSLLWLLMHALIAAYQGRSAGLLTLIVGSVVYFMTGNVVRQPTVWFAFALCLTAEPLSSARELVANRLLQLRS